MIRQKSPHRLGVRKALHPIRQRLGSSRQWTRAIHVALHQLPVAFIQTLVPKFRRMPPFRTSSSHQGIQRKHTERCVDTHAAGGGSRAGRVLLAARQSVPLTRQNKELRSNMAGKPRSSAFRPWLSMRRPVVPRICQITPLEIQKSLIFVPDVLTAVSGMSVNKPIFWHRPVFPGGGLGWGCVVAGLARADHFAALHWLRGAEQLSRALRRVEDRV